MGSHFKPSAQLQFVEKGRKESVHEFLTRVLSDQPSLSQRLPPCTQWACSLLTGLPESLQVLAAATKSPWTTTDTPRGGPKVAALSPARHTGRAKPNTTHWAGWIQAWTVTEDMEPGA